MTTKQMQKIEKMASDSLRYARQALEKSEELQALLSLMEYRGDRKNKYSSIDNIFKKLKISI